MNMVHISKIIKILLAITSIIIISIICSCNKYKEPVKADLSSYITNGNVIYILYNYEWLMNKEENIYNNLKAGKFIESSDQIKQALQRREGELSNEELLTLKNALAISYACLANYQEAQKVIENEIFPLINIDQNYQINQSIFNNMACIIFGITRENPAYTLNDVDKYFKKALNETGEQDTMDSLVIQTNDCFTVMGELRLGNASYYFKRAVKEMADLADKEKKLLGSNQIISIYNYANMGRLLSMSLECKKGEKYLNKALDLFKEMGNANFNMDLVEAGIYERLGECYLYWEKPDLAIELTRKALTIHQEILGGNHMLTGIDYNIIGVSYKHKYDCEKALENLVKALGSGNPSSWEEYNTYLNLSSTYYYMGEYKEALKWRLKLYQIEVAFDDHNQEDSELVLRQLYSYCDIGDEQDYDQWLKKQRAGENE